MRNLLVFLALSTTSSAFAETNLCNSYLNNEVETAALQMVAAQQKYSLDELCTLPRLLDIEVQPSQIITPEGFIIPHTSVQLHYEEYTCLYKVRSSDHVLTSSRCFSTF